MGVYGYFKIQREKSKILYLKSNSTANRESAEIKR